MKLSLSLEQFKSVLSLAERMTTKGSGLPVLAGVYLEACEKKLVIRATNLSIGIEESIPAKVEVSGKVVVPAQAAMAALSGASSQTITLEESGGSLVITLSHGRVSLRTMPADDFPTLPRIDTVNPWKIKAKNIVSGLKAVSFAAAQTEIKPELASIYLYQEGDTINIFRAQ
jgi:DNA polymerase III subunit beta